MFKNWRGGLQPRRNARRVCIDEFDAADALDTKAPASVAEQPAFEAALEDLRSRHLSFRAPEKSEENTLDDLRLEILTAVTENNELQASYFATPGTCRPGRGWRAKCRRRRCIDESR